MNASLWEHSQEFLNYLEGWLDGLPEVSLGVLLRDPAKAALISVDVIRGFCDFGPLSSPRMHAIVPAVVELMRAAHAGGVRQIVLA